MSQESSAGRGAGSSLSGGAGYVVKAHAGAELLTAVEAVLQGGSLSAPGCRANISLLRRIRRLLIAPMSSVSPLASGRMEIARSHEVEFYSDDAALWLASLVSSKPALESRNAVIVIAIQGTP